jgi:hypothetical protein
MSVTELATDLQLALDPVQLAERAGIAADPWQADVLRSTAPCLALNCCRQAGKSLMAAILAVHTVVYTPASLVLVLSPSLRQSQELFRKCLDTYYASGRPVPAGATSALRLELANDSRIISLPGVEETVRGYSNVRLLICDEAARIEDPLYQACRPMLATSQGRLVALSTPAGKRGWWYREWVDGGERWERYEVPATQCPRISPQFLEEERQSLGAQVFASEYGCEFSDVLTQVFATADIERAITPAVTPLFGG